MHKLNYFANWALAVGGLLFVAYMVVWGVDILGLELWRRLFTEPAAFFKQPLAVVALPVPLIAAAIVATRQGIEHTKHTFTAAKTFKRTAIYAGLALGGGLLSLFFVLFLVTDATLEPEENVFLLVARILCITPLAMCLVYFLSGMYGFLRQTIQGKQQPVRSRAMWFMLAVVFGILGLGGGMVVVSAIQLQASLNVMQVVLLLMCCALGAKSIYYTTKALELANR